MSSAAEADVRRKVAAAPPPLALRLIAVPRAVLLSLVSLSLLCVGAPLVLLSSLAAWASQKRLEQSLAVRSTTSSPISSLLSLLSGTLLGCVRLALVLAAGGLLYMMVSIAVTSAMDSVLSPSRDLVLAETSAGGGQDGLGFYPRLALGSESLLEMVFVAPVQLLGLPSSGSLHAASDRRRSSATQHDREPAPSPSTTLTQEGDHSRTLLADVSYWSQAASLLVPWFMLLTVYVSLSVAAPRAVSRWLVRIRTRFSSGPTSRSSQFIAACVRILALSTPIPLVRFGVLGALLDLAALVLWTGVLALVIRVRSVFEHFFGSPAKYLPAQQSVTSSSTPQKRSQVTIVILPATQFFFSVLDWICVFLAIAQCILAPWRVKDTYTAWTAAAAVKNGGQNELEAARRKLLLRGAIDALIDFPFFLLTLPVILSVWRSHALWRAIGLAKDWNSCRSICVQQFVEFLKDLPFALMTAVVCAPLYRAPTLIRMFRGDSEGSAKRMFVAKQFACVVLCDPLLFGFSPAILAVILLSRRRRLLTRHLSPSSSPLDRGFLFHASFLQDSTTALLELLVFDIPTVLALACLALLTPWRVVTAWRAWPRQQCSHGQVHEHATTASPVLAVRRSVALRSVLLGVLDPFVVLSAIASMLLLVHAESGASLLGVILRRRRYANVSLCKKRCACSQCATEARTSDAMRRQRAEVAQWRATGGQRDAAGSTAVEERASALFAVTDVVEGNPTLPNFLAFKLGVRLFVSALVDAPLIFLGLMLVVLPWRVRSLFGGLRIAGRCTCMSRVRTNTSGAVRSSCKERRLIVVRVAVLWVLDAVSLSLTVTLLPFLWRWRSLLACWSLKVSSSKEVSEKSYHMNEEMRVWWHQHRVVAGSDSHIMCLLNELYALVFADIPFAAASSLLAITAPWRFRAAVLGYENNAVRLVTTDTAGLRNMQRDQLRTRRKHTAVVVSAMARGARDWSLAMLSCVTLWRFPLALWHLREVKSHNVALQVVGRHIKEAFFDIPTIPFILLLGFTPSSWFRLRMAYLVMTRQGSADGPPLPWRTMIVEIALLGFLDCVCGLISLTTILLPWRTLCVARIFRAEITRVRQLMRKIDRGTATRKSGMQEEIVPHRVTLNRLNRSALRFHFDSAALFYQGVCDISVLPFVAFGLASVSRSRHMWWLARDVALNSCHYCAIHAKSPRTSRFVVLGVCFAAMADWCCILLGLVSCFTWRYRSALICLRELFSSLHKPSPEMRLWFDPHFNIVTLAFNILCDAPFVLLSPLTLWRVSGLVREVKKTHQGSASSDFRAGNRQTPSSRQPREQRGSSDDMAMLDSDWKIRFMVLAALWEVICDLPFVVCGAATLVCFPWRFAELYHYIRGPKDNGLSLWRKRQLSLEVLILGIGDAFVLTLSLPVMLTVWRGRKVIIGMRLLSIASSQRPTNFSSKKHVSQQFKIQRFLIKNFLHWALDLPFVPVYAAALLLAPWRAPFVVRFTQNDDQKYRRVGAVVFLFIALLDYCCLLGSLPVLATGWRARALIAAARQPRTSESNALEFPRGRQRSVLLVIWNWILDCPFAPLYLVVFLSLYRRSTLLSAVKDSLSDGQGRIRVAVHFGYVVQDIIIIPLCLVATVLISPWRVGKLRRHRWRSSSPDDWVSSSHAFVYATLGRGISDFPFLLMFASSAVLAPWRLISLFGILQASSRTSTRPILGRRARITGALLEALRDWATLAPLAFVALAVTMYRLAPCVATIRRKYRSNPSKQRRTIRRFWKFLFWDFICVFACLPAIVFGGGVWRLPDLISRLLAAADRSTWRYRPQALHRMVFRELFWTVTDLGQIAQILFIFCSVMHVHTFVSRMKAVFVHRRDQARALAALRERSEEAEFGSADNRRSPEDTRGPPEDALAESWFGELPPDVITSHIFSQLSPVEACDAALVCRAFSSNRLARSPRLWSDLYARDFGADDLVDSGTNFSGAITHPGHPFQLYAQEAQRTDSLRWVFVDAGRGATADVLDENVDFFSPPTARDPAEQALADDRAGYRTIIHSEFVGAVYHLPHLCLLPLKLLSVLLFPLLMYAKCRSDRLDRSNARISRPAGAVPPASSRWHRVADVVIHGAPYPEDIWQNIFRSRHPLGVAYSEGRKRFSIWHCHVVLAFECAALILAAMMETTVLLVSCNVALVLAPMDALGRSGIVRVLQALLFPLVALAQAFLVFAPLFFLWPHLPSRWFFWIPLLILGSGLWLFVMGGSWMRTAFIAKKEFKNFQPQAGARLVWSAIDHFARKMSSVIFTAILKILSVVRAVGEAIWSVLVVVFSFLWKKLQRVVFWAISATFVMDWVLGMLTFRCFQAGTLGELVLIPLSVLYIAFPLLVFALIPAQDIVRVVHTNVALDIHAAALAVEGWIQSVVPQTEFLFNPDLSAARMWPLWVPFIALALVQLRKVKFVIQNNWVKANPAYYDVFGGAKSPFANSSLLDVRSVHVTSPVSDDGHGVELRIQGLPPNGLFSSNTNRRGIQAPEHVRLVVEGDELWRNVTATAGRAIVTTVRHTMLPLTLTPHYFDIEQLRSLFSGEGDMVDARLVIGTGDRGNKRIKFRWETINGMLRSLRDNGDPSILLRLEVGKDSWGAWTPMGTFAEIRTKPSRVIFSVEQGGDIRDPALSIDADSNN